MKRSIRTVAGTVAAVVLAAAASIVMSASPGKAANQTHHVSVLSNFYSERVTYISPGDTVVWTAIDQLHTVFADDGRFQYFPLRELDRGQQVRYTFLNEETVPYYCRVHGNRGGVGMSGVVVVGRGSPRPTPSGMPEIRTVPSVAYPTITAALNLIPPDSIVRVQPGTYRERVVVQTPGVAVVGAGGSPGDVRIDGGLDRASGVILAAARTRVENLSVVDQTAEGIAVRGADGASVRDVVASHSGLYGIIVADSTGVTVQRATASRARIAAVSVKGCAACSAVVSESVMEQSRFGVLADNAGGIQIERNTIRQNETGVAVRSLVISPGVARGGVRIVDNQIIENRAAGTGFAGTEFAVRSGVWLAGAVRDVVEDNVITGHDYGVLVTSFIVPSLAARIAGNSIGSSTKADLAWDGIGINVCFESNHTPFVAEPSSHPPMAQTLYACSAPATVGVPEPTVIADLALYAVSGNVSAP